MTNDDMNDLFALITSLIERVDALEAEKADTEKMIGLIVDQLEEAQNRSRQALDIAQQPQRDAQARAAALGITYENPKLAEMMARRG
jgi:hypothetical protein